MLVSAVNMLKFMGLEEFGDKIYKAMLMVYERGDFITSDLGGQASREEFTRAVIGCIEELERGVVGGQLRDTWEGER